AQALDRHAEPNRHARHRDKFGPAGSDRAGTAWLNALAVKAAVGLGKTSEIGVKVLAQAFGEGLPGGLRLLDRRLGEPLQLPAIDCPRTGIPRPYQESPGRVVRCPRGGLGAIPPVIIQHLVVDRRRADAAGRAVADKAVEPIPDAVIQPATEPRPLGR